MKRHLIAATLAALAIGGGVALAGEDATDKAGKAVDDATLVASVKAKLLSSPDVEGLDVNVDARNGVVTLSGSADTAAEKASAEKIAKAADGVKSVNNRIEVKPAGAAREDARDRAPAQREAPPIR